MARSSSFAWQRRHGVVLVVLVVGVLGGCAPTAVSTPSGTPAGPPLAPPTPSPAATSTPTPAPTGEGFPFTAGAIVGYYETLGYTCGDVHPSTVVAGFGAQTCTLRDPDGRTRTIGIVTDPDGLVANGFASITGTAGEELLDPTVALEPLSAFLGAMLGAEPGAELVPWLAGRLGDTYAQTVAGPITVAAYTPSADDHSTLTVEVGNDEYLNAPGTPAPS
jgi:hypothetical protein